MRITINFSSVKDLSNISNGNKLLEILSSYGLRVEKVGNYEPVKTEFSENDVPRLWNDGFEADVNRDSCIFLFKGKKEISFSGMVSWDKDLHPKSMAFNGIFLRLNIPKKYNASKLIMLGDELFAWSEAVYGFISEESRYEGIKKDVNIHMGIEGLMWVNYFGLPYIKEPDFKLISNFTNVAHGKKLIVSEAPEDDKLEDLDYIDSLKNEIGNEWFIKKTRSRKVPFFDKTSLIKK